MSVLVFLEVLDIGADQLGAAQRAGKAEQQNRPIAMTREILAAAVEQLAQQIRRQGRRLLHRTSLGALEAGQDIGDRRVPAIEREAFHAVLMRDPGQRAFDGGRRSAPCPAAERGDVEPDGRRRRQQRIQMVLRAPRPERSPVAIISATGIGGFCRLAELGRCLCNVR
jgi:hypothetical protein